MGFVGYIRDASCSDWNSDLALVAEEGDATFWRRWDGGGREFYLELGEGEGWIFPFASGCLVLKGFARWVGAGGGCQTNWTRIADYYVSTGELPWCHLEGSFTLVLMDVKRSIVLLYRNLVGCESCYYSRFASGIALASNLADVIDCVGGCVVNDALLPIHFLYRCVPGRDTLVRGVHRLMPGELVELDEQRCQRSQIDTLAVRGSQRNADADELEGVLGEVLGDYLEACPDVENLLSGGVDSSYLQAVLNAVRGGEERESFAVEVAHARCQGDADYARSAAAALGCQQVMVRADGPVAGYLTETIAQTAETPNHVMGIYFIHLGRELHRRGVGGVLCGEGADSLFGSQGSVSLQRAKIIRRWLPKQWSRTLAIKVVGAVRLGRIGELLQLAGHLADVNFEGHPVFRSGLYTDVASVLDCFGAEGLRSGIDLRQALFEDYAVGDCPLEQMRACGLLSDAVDSSAHWATLTEVGGTKLFAPYLDSRIVKLVLSRHQGEMAAAWEAKGILKQALSRYVPRHIVRRPKLGFGQPIFEWLAVGGPLRRLVDEIGDYDFVPKDVLARGREQPNWFLYSLLCFDIWHKLFVERSLSGRKRWRAKGSGFIGRTLVG